MANVTGPRGEARGARCFATAVALATTLLCVRSVRADDAAPAPTQRWTPVFEREGVVTVRNQRVLPRAWLVSEVRALNAARILKLVRGESREAFDPRRTALLEVDEAALPRIGGAAAAGDTARLVSYTDGRISLETRSAAAAFLVVSETYFPGWEATVDGTPARIYQTNYVLQGVSVPAGLHRVEMRYRTAGAAVGSVISLGTLALLAGMLVYSARRRPRREITPSLSEKSQSE